MASERLVELPPRPASAAEARRFVERALHGATPQSRETSVLLTSELVTNAILYAQGRITVRVVVAPGSIRVVVTDGDPHEVEPRRVGLEATSGRGLALVERLSATWGVEVLATGDGKEVWFEVPRHD